MTPNRFVSVTAALAVVVVGGGALAQAPAVQPPLPGSSSVQAASPAGAVLSSPRISAAPQVSLSPAAPVPARPAWSVSPRRAFSVNASASAGRGAVVAGRGLSPSEAVPGDPDDPAYALYKEAYELILREKWEEARNKFSALAKNYPDSEYRDDAEYWIAYSWRETNQKKAIEAYKRFLKTYKQSTYFDDALADMDQLMARSMVVALPSTASAPAVAARPALSVFPGDSGLSVTAYTLPALAPMMKLRNLERMLRTPRPGARLGWADEDEGVDDATRLRLETLYAIGMTGEDEKGFTTLKSIAVDPKEKRVLRVAAIEGLSEFRRHDILPVFIEIAKNDTSEEMQLFAIDYIGSAAHDKEKAFDALMTLYTSLPPEKIEKRKMVFYSIAEVGNDKAIDFLAGIAKSHDDFELRREAIYYLGTIGGEKARAVLFDLVKEQ